MIVTKEVEITMRPNNIKYYKDKGYNCKMNEKIIIKVEDLLEFSHVKVDCECQNCYSIINLGFHNYNKNISKYNIYYCNKCKSIKIKKTLKDVYNADSIFEIDGVLERVKKTNIMKYGTEHPSSCDIVKDKISKSLKEIYNEKGDEIINMKKENSLKKYGVEYPQSLDSTKEKTKNTIFSRYGVYNVSKLTEIKDKIKKTTNDRYGTEYYTQTNEYKNYMKSLKIDYNSIQEKCKKTSLIRYGVEYPAQNIEIYTKTQKSQLKINYYNDIQYQGTYELDFLVMLYDLNILQFISKLKSIKYNFNGKCKYYHPDFFIYDLNLIIEIKSSYYYNLHIEQNISKMKSCIENGFDFIFIIDKNYNEFYKKIKVLL